MPTPGEHKTVQAHILEYAGAVGWTIVLCEEVEHRRGFDPSVSPADRARNRSLFFSNLLDAKVRESNPRYAEAEGALLGQFRHLHTDIHGNRTRPPATRVWPLGRPLSWRLTHEAMKGRLYRYSRQKAPLSDKNKGYATSRTAYMSRIGF